LRTLIEQQRQPGEAPVECVARLRPLGDTRQAVVVERARDVAQDGLQRAGGEFGDCLAGAQRLPQRA